MAHHLEAWVDELDDNLAHGKVAIFNPIRWDPDTWPARPPATAGMKLRAARSATGSRSKARRSRTIRPWFPPPGTPDRATPRPARAPTRRRSSTRRSPIPTGRSKSCAPFTRSIPASPARCTSSTHRDGNIRFRHRRVPLRLGGADHGNHAVDRESRSTDAAIREHADWARPSRVYVWQYPLRLVHWGIVISIGVLSFTGYYIHDPFIVGQLQVSVPDGRGSASCMKASG